MERWKDIIYLGQHSDGCVSTWFTVILACSPAVLEECVHARVRVLSTRQAEAERRLSRDFQSLIPRICFDYLTEMAWIKRWKDIIYLGQHPDGPLKCLNYCEPCVFVGDLNDAYARAHPLSTASPGTILTVRVKYRLLCGVFSIITCNYFTF